MEGGGGPDQENLFLGIDKKRKTHLVELSPSVGERKESVSRRWTGAIKKIKRDLETRQIFYNQDLVYCLETYNFCHNLFHESYIYIKI